ncbi:MAG: serine hydrolase [Bacteroidota bacterium]
MFRRLFNLLLVLAALSMMSSKQFSFDSFVQAKLATSGVFLLPYNAVTSTPTISPIDAMEAKATKVVVAPLQELRQLHNNDLQAVLEETLNAHPVWRKLLRNQRMSVGIVNLAKETEVKYAAVNGQHMMYAASLPKIAVLAAAHDAIERGELQESADVRRDMRLMIAKSNNAATTRMIDRLGFTKIERTMTSPSLKLYDPAFGGGLWVGKRYAAGGKRHPDPIKGISHAATAEQVCRYFYKLVNNDLISPASSEKMKSYLVNPELHHKFVNTLDQVAPDATVYRKSGSWKTFHADVALVQGPQRNYIITALIQDPKGEEICRELAKVLDGLLAEA